MAGGGTYPGFQSLVVAHDGAGDVRLLATVDKAGRGPDSGIYLQSDWSGPLGTWEEISQKATAQSPGHPELVSEGDFENCDAATCPGPTDCRALPPSWTERGTATQECLDCATDPGNCFLRIANPTIQGHGGGAEIDIGGIAEGETYLLSYRLLVNGDPGDSPANPLLAEVIWKDSFGQDIKDAAGDAPVRVVTLLGSANGDFWHDHWGFPTSGTGGQWVTMHSYLRPRPTATSVNFNLENSASSNAETWIDDVSLELADELPLTTGRANHELNWAERLEINPPADSRPWYGQIAVDNSAPDVIYALTDAGTFSEETGAMGGVWKTADNGLTWNLVTREATVRSDGASTDLRSGPFDISNQYAGRSLVAGQGAAAGLVYMGSGKYIYKSSDAGVSWTETTATAVPSDTDAYPRSFFKSNGEINNVVTHTVATHPAHPEWVLYDDADGHLSFSEDGGQTFTKIAKGPDEIGPSPWPGKGDGVTSIIFDANDPGGNTILVAVGTGSVDKFGSGGAVLEGTYDASNNPRWTFTEVGTTPWSNAAYTQLIQQQEPGSPDYDLFAAVFKTGAYRWDGDMWHDEKPLFSGELRAYRLAGAPGGDRLFMAGGNPRAAGLAAGLSLGVGLWIRNKSEAVWKKISAVSNPAISGEHIISLYAASDDEVFVSTYRGSQATTFGKMYKVSWDGEAWSWEAKLDQPKITSIVATPGAPNVMWAFSSQFISDDDPPGLETGFHTSTDSGDTWVRSLPDMGLLDFTDTRLAFHADFASTSPRLELFMATDGGGV